LEIVDFLLKNGTTSNTIYYPNEALKISETILEMVYFELQNTEEHIRNFKIYRYISIDGMDEEILSWKVK